VYYTITKHHRTSINGFTIFKNHSIKARDKAWEKLCEKEGENGERNYKNTKLTTKEFIYSRTKKLW
jgi:hypothetical protein